MTAFFVPEAASPTISSTSPRSALLCSCSSPLSDPLAWPENRTAVADLEAESCTTAPSHLVFDFSSPPWTLPAPVVAIPSCLAPPAVGRPRRAPRERDLRSKSCFRLLPPVRRFSVAGLTGTDRRLAKYIFSVGKGSGGSCSLAVVKFREK